MKKSKNILSLKLTTIASLLFASAAANASIDQNIALHIIDWVSQTTSDGAQTETVVGILSFYLNTLCLTVAGVVIGYKTWSYARFIAAKGVAGNERMAMGVTTLRSAIAIACLAPVIHGGQSIAQISLTNLARFAVSYTDDATVAIAGHMESTGGVVTLPQFGMDSVIANVIRAELCHAYIDSADRFALLARGSVSETDITPFNVVLDGDTLSYRWGFEPRSEDTSWYKNDYDNSEHCGGLSLRLANNIQENWIRDDTISVSLDGSSLNIKESDPIYTPVIEEQHAAVMRLILTARSEIPALVEDLKLINDLTASQALGLASAEEVEAMRASVAAAESNVDATVKRIAVGSGIGKAYKETVEITAKNAAARVHESIEMGSMDGYTWKDELEEKGFLALGTYYMVISKTTQAILSAQEHRVSATSKASWEVNDEVPGMGESFHTQIESISKRLDSVFKEYLADNRTNIGFDFVATSGLGGKEEDGGGIWASMVRGTADWLKKSLNQGTGDIIVRLQTMGTLIATTAEIALLTLGVAALATKIALMFSGVGLVASTVTSSGSDVFLGALIKWLLVFAVVGSTLQIALPFIPLLYWITAMMSWAMSYALALFFVPIWMLTHVFASSEDWMSEHSRSGYMMILEVIARPLLMVVGFMMAYILMRVSSIGLDIATGYLFGLASDWLGLGAIVTIFGLSMYVAYKLLVRCYSLVSELSDMLLNRAGAGQASFGEKSDADQQSMFIAAMISKSTGSVGKLAPKQEPKLPKVPPTKA